MIPNGSTSQFERSAAVLVLAGLAIFGAVRVGTQLPNQISVPMPQVPKTVHVSAGLQGQTNRAHSMLRPEMKYVLSGRNHYSYKILTRHGAVTRGDLRPYRLDRRPLLGLTLVAWPVEYGRSGIFTFIVNQLGQVYEKDLGPQTAELA